MPTYDLRCKACKKEFSTMATMAAKEQKRIPCPECGNTQLETLFRTAPAVLKGASASACPNSHICGAGCRHAQ